MIIASLDMVGSDRYLAYDDRQIKRFSFDYFKFFQGFASNIDIIPIPNEHGKSDSDHDSGL